MRVPSGNTSKSGYSGHVTVMQRMVLASRLNVPSHFDHGPVMHVTGEAARRLPERGYRGGAHREAAPAVQAQTRQTRQIIASIMPMICCRKSREPFAMSMQDDHDDDIIEMAGSAAQRNRSPKPVSAGAPAIRQPPPWRRSNGRMRRCWCSATPERERINVLYRRAKMATTAGWISAELIRVCRRPAWIETRWLSGNAFCLEVRMTVASLYPAA